MKIIGLTSLINVIRGSILKRWFYSSLLLVIVLSLSFSTTIAQDKTTTRQRAALSNILAEGSQEIAVGDLLVDDDFSESDTWEVYKDKDSNLRTVDDVYRMTLDGDLYTWALNDEEHSDVIIEVETSQISEDLNNHYGVMCRADSEGSGYFFFISGDGYYSIYKGSDDDLEALAEWETSDAINQGEDNNSLVAVCVEDYLALYANGTLLAEANDDEYSSGFAGFSIG